MPKDRDVQAFEERAASYESGVLGQLHRDISGKVADLAVSVAPEARRVLDVGSGTGYLLGLLAGRLPGAEELTGVDAASSMVTVARGRAADGRLCFAAGTAERIPADGGRYDLVVSTTSFDHWADQAAGLAECARVLAPGGRLVLADQFSLLLWPTLLAGRRGKARTRGRATRLVTAAGFRSPHWHRLHAVIIQAVTAVR
jgi:ubiquinone/menaquinone biosynthesis C-methylase UbiE